MDLASPYDGRPGMRRDLFDPHIAYPGDGQARKTMAMTSSMKR